MLSSKFIIHLDSQPGVRPGGRVTFLLHDEESNQRNVPRLADLTASGYPRCERPAGPSAKLASLGQRGRKTPDEPSSLGGSEGEAAVPLGYVEKLNDTDPFDLL